jgi:hypothetical protein
MKNNGSRLGAIPFIPFLEKGAGNAFLRPNVENG